MARFSSFLLALATVTASVNAQSSSSICRGDEITIDMSDPSAARPLVYVLDYTKDQLPNGVTLNRRTGIISGVIRDTGFQNRYNVGVIGTDPTTQGTYESIATIISEWCQGTRVSRFLLLDTDTNKIVRVVNDGDTIDLGCMGGFSIEAETFSEFAREAQSEGDLTARVKFTLDGKSIRTEKAFPFLLGGDVDGDYIDYSIAPGRHTLTATPYNPSGAVGKNLTITFTIVGDNHSQAPKGV